MRYSWILVLLLGLVAPAHAQLETINCPASVEGTAVVALCSLLGRLDDSTILRSFSIEGGSLETLTKQEFVDELIGHPATDRRVLADDYVAYGGVGYVFVSFASQAVCSTVAGKVIECIGSIPQRGSFDACRSESVSDYSSLDGVSFIVCDIVAAWGTGYLETGRLYFSLDDRIRYVGYFPMTEEVAHPESGEDYRINATAELSMGSGGAALLDRCITIETIHSPSRSLIVSRCEKYELYPDGRVTALQGRSTLNRRASDVYRDLLPAHP